MLHNGECCLIFSIRANSAVEVVYPMFRLLVTEWPDDATAWGLPTR
jgi:hypothetical protein